ncbi:MAG: dTDP-4-dehydrorhamnose reductase [Bacteroidetes bacterium]|nr:dTDP-4-dehydrorhamnose reductase [Bacteroidota bacterium]MBS1973463.1 dTDP-4-dehydrorhamnose reductase [Bacteroidota bacterium]
MSKPIVLVTGANGQLGQEIQAASPFYPGLEFIFLSRSDLAITDQAKVRAAFEKSHPSFCINCAAYTAVDKAESDKETAFGVNAEAVGYLAAVCRLFNTKFIHISTDYVFDGNSPSALKEDDPKAPINVYGASKLKGEELAMKENGQTVIIRTSWVYSSFGNNFVKTMMKLMRERESINVVNDQIGSPTYAYDLAKDILNIASSREFVPGIYHYSNDGEISWYDFAVAIKQAIESNCKVYPIPSSKYPTPAKRPHYSLLDKTKICATYHVQLKEWKESLLLCISKMQGL